MYLVVNQSKRIVTISDLDVSIPAGTMMDLDKYRRNKHLNPKDSKDLKQALHSGLLRTMQSDKSAPKKEEPTPTPQPQMDYSEMMKMMKDTIREEMEKNKPEPAPVPAPQTTVVQQDNAQLVEMMSDIKKLIASGAMSSADADIAQEFFVGDDVDEERIKEIHAAAMKKMKDKSGLKSEISYDTNTVKDTNISDNLSDLEDLI